MSQYVNVGHVKQYADRVDHLLQQRGSKLMQASTQHSFTGKAAQIVQQIGATSVYEVTTRHQDTQLIDTPHAARWMRPRDYATADMVDKQDLARMIIDPRSPYATAQQYGLGRQCDDLFIDAFDGTAFTGEDGLDTVTFANDGGTTIAASGLGLTIDKLREAKETLAANEVDLDSEEICCIITAKQENDLLGETQVTSGDYNKPMFAGDGRIRHFFGIGFYHCERLNVDGSGDRKVLFYAKSRMHTGMWNGIQTEVDKRPDKNNNHQVLSSGTFGSARSEGEGCVVITCQE